MVKSPVSGRRVPGPEPTAVPVTRLADRVLCGDIVLPKYQRGFVWTRQQVLYLLDSVHRNYPIGSLLLWQTTQELGSESEVAGLDVDEPRRGYPVNYIIDGQQRIASLVGALHGDSQGWQFGYDLEEERFLHLDELPDDTPIPAYVIPMRRVGSAASLFGQVADLRPELRDRMEVLYEQFTNYQIPVVTLHELTESDSSRIFERINSTGTAMNIVDLMRAATWSPDFDLKEEIEKLLGVLDAKNYGRVDTKTMLRTIAASARFGFSRSDINRLRDLSKDELREAGAEAGKAAERAVDFLCTQIRTPRAEALPYYNQFAVLVEIFRQLSKPSAAQYEALERWFWLTASGEYFKNWSESQMGPDLAAVSAFARGETEEIDTGAALPRSTLWRRSPFSKRNAPSKLLGLLLSYENPLDLLTGRRVDAGKALSWQNDKEFHHFFPRAFLRDQGIKGANVCGNLVMITSNTNIWISDRSPSRYLRDLRDLEGEDALRKRLQSCLVEEDAYQAALRDDYEGFLLARSETLHRRLMQLIGTAAGGPAVAPAALASMVGSVDDESDSQEPEGADEPLDRDSAD
ncbi:DUF262 domain-containing protein [Streptomyces kanamyceticus]|uniref:DUF262 domain-containing protein n=1 Tax=Streptomyces kanamyceticus TaxID=1967 RepID=A0A5J6GPF6_STRKN|nr:DUF262 domain-containing protein [Streptomyces kanamyceticus]